MQFAKPLPCEPAVAPVGRQVSVAPGVFEKQPGILLVRIRRVPVAAKQWHRNLRQNPLVNDPLDAERDPSCTFGDNVAAIRRERAQPVDGRLLVALQHLDGRRGFVATLQLPPSLERLVVPEAFGQHARPDETRHQSTPLVTKIRLKPRTRRHEAELANVETYTSPKTERFSPPPPRWRGRRTASSYLRRWP